MSNGIDLEERFLFLERQVEVLDSVVRDLDGRIDALRHELRQMSQALARLGEPPASEEEGESEQGA